MPTREQGRPDAGNAHDRPSRRRRSRIQLARRREDRALAALAAWCLIAVPAGCKPKEGLAELSERPYDSVRDAISLNGTWDIAEGDLGDTAPTTFDGTVPVPALVTAAVPAFAEVGEPSTLRDAFWYRRSFDGPTANDVAILDIHKAKYGIRVWLNDALLGDHEGSYSTASFEVTGALRSGEANTLLVRVGDYRDQVPETVPAGQDYEKERWIPGIYDDVLLILTSCTRIVRVKVEPDIDRDVAGIQTLVENRCDDDVRVEIENHVVEWQGESPVSLVAFTRISLAAGEERLVEQELELSSVSLWSPEDPFLYVARTAIRRDDSVVDNLETRFGMRKVEWRGAPDYGGRFYLNDELYYLRGSNITLHRFFEDPLAGALPWDRDWVRELLSSHPKDLHWNAFRISVGRAPNFWYDIADEEGLLLADEFMMWTALSKVADSWSADAMAVEYTSWVQENWNHPSIAWWDASNETYMPLSTMAIDAVRDLDPTRAWENGGFNGPHSLDDPIEDHPYLFMDFSTIIPIVPPPTEIDLRLLETNDGMPPQGGVVGTALGTANDPTHPYLINEYGWFWINRDGTPTTLTAGNFEVLLGPAPHDPDVVREAYAYLVGGLTEFWRARRGYAGVLHFTYLTYSRVGGQTSDNFVDITTLELEPRWAEYAGYAFAPLMVYIDTWRSDHPPGATDIPVITINDHNRALDVTLIVMAVAPDGTVAASGTPETFSIDAFGSASSSVSITLPALPQYLLVAKVSADGEPDAYSRRKVGFATVGELGPDPPFQGE